MELTNWLLSNTLIGSLVLPSQFSSGNFYLKDSQHNWHINRSVRVPGTEWVTNECFLIEKKDTIRRS